MTFFYLPSLNSWLLHFKKTSFWKSPSRKSEGPDNCVVNLQWRQHLVDTTVVDRFVLNRFLVFCFFFVCLFVCFFLVFFFCGPSGREDAVDEHEIQSFFTEFTALLRLLQSELRLMLGIIPLQHQKMVPSVFQCSIVPGPRSSPVNRTGAK